MTKRERFSPEVKERAVRLVREQVLVVHASRPLVDCGEEFQRDQGLAACQAHSQRAEGAPGQLGQQAVGQTGLPLCSDRGVQPVVHTLAGVMALCVSMKWSGAVVSSVGPTLAALVEGAFLYWAMRRARDRSMLGAPTSS